MESKELKRKVFNKLHQRYKRSKPNCEPNNLAILPLANNEIPGPSEASSEAIDHDRNVFGHCEDNLYDHHDSENSDFEENCDFSQFEEHSFLNNVTDNETLNIPQSDASKKTLIDQLSEWALKHNINHRALSDLLGILKENFDNTTLPKDPRTVLKTPRNTGSLIDEIKPGFYFHFGLENSLKNLLNRSKITNTINNILDICINIDGLPLSKSSGSQLWPIMVNIFQNKNLVEICGVYQGNKKPENANLFLEKFVNETINLTSTGFTYNNKKYIINIKAFICDVPAKAFVKCTRGHSGYMSCSKCNTEGLFKGNRICFPVTEGYQLRTDGTFRSKEQDSHHTGTSVLEQIPGLDMIRCFPLDYMHLVCLGVVKKLISNLWLGGKPPYRFSSQQIREISERHLSLHNQVPSEFSRKPRLLSEIKHWKATELRLFLFYTGPVVLKGTVSEEIYQNFLSLHIAITLFSKCEYIEYASELAKYFVETFCMLYGEENISHNVHNILHIADDVREFGSIENYSAFPFENNMLFLKKLVRKGDQPLQQIVNRIAERSKCYFGTGNCNKVKQPELKIEHSDGPLLNSIFGIKQYKKVYLENYILSIHDSDNCCRMDDKNIVIIKNIISFNGDISVIGQKYLQLENFYNTPCASSKLNIFSVSQEGPIDSWSLSQVIQKFMKLKINNKLIVLPLLHITT